MSREISRIAVEGTPSSSACSTVITRAIVRVCMCVWVCACGCAGVCARACVQCRGCYERSSRTNKDTVGDAGETHFQLDLLESHKIRRSPDVGFVHCAIRPFTNLLDLHVLLHGAAWPCRCSRKRPCPATPRPRTRACVDSLGKWWTRAFLSLVARVPV